MCPGLVDVEGGNWDASTMGGCLGWERTGDILLVKLQSTREKPLMPVRVDGGDLTQFMITVALRWAPMGF